MVIFVEVEDTHWGIQRSTQPSITVQIASGAGCLAETSSFSKLIEIYISSESMNSAIDTDDILHEITSLISIPCELTWNPIIIHLVVCHFDWLLCYCYCFNFHRNTDRAVFFQTHPFVPISIASSTFTEDESIISFTTLMIVCGCCCGSNRLIHIPNFLWKPPVNLVSKTSSLGFFFVCSLNEIWSFTLSQNW